ncbi:MAG TPA: diguanylate cyclase [Vicinamibacterales bacterium]|nr:diguanylate cyclase [Vicinamibacterales bacterium]
MTADERREQAEATLDSLADAVLTTDLDGRVSYLNPAAEALTGWSRQEAANQPVADVFRILGAGADCVLVSRDGRVIEVEHTATTLLDAHGQTRGEVIVFRDAGPAREASRHLSHLAAHDALTDLPNRLLLNDRLTRAIAFAERHNKPVAVLFLDVDGFKAVNDSLGHAAGDAILRSIARRLKAVLRRSDTVSRYSGDEFVIVLPEIDQTDDAALVAKKLVRAASGPHRIDARNVTVTASVGIALYPDDGRDAEVLIKHADSAMYQAKRTGAGSFRLFRPDLHPAPDVAAPEAVAPPPPQAPEPRRRAWTRRGTFPLFEDLDDLDPGRTGRH